MKVTIAQINSTVNKTTDNTKRIKKIITDAPDSLIIFPEMAVTGYPLNDLSNDSDVRKSSYENLEDIINTSRGLGKDIIVGHLGGNLSDTLPTNAVTALINGEVYTGSKKALPTYDVFDEKRLFATDDTPFVYFTRDGLTHGVMICEDLWDIETRQQIKPVDVLIVINGSPYEKGKALVRRQMMTCAMESTQASYGVYVNLVGGQDELLFDGGSFAIRRENNEFLFSKTVRFTESIATVDVTSFKPAHEEDDDAASMYEAAVLGLRDYVRKNRMKSVLLGVSGGIDSALVAAIAADAIGGENVYGISMPSKFSSEGSKTDAKLLMKNIGGHYREIPIKDMFDTFMSSYVAEGIAQENLQARLRGVILMTVSNQEGHLVLAPGNKSELAVGYSTIYGDSVGGYAPIKDAYKVEVYAMARYRNLISPVIPVDSIEKVPSAELREDQVDSESLPPYELLDAILTDYIDNKLAHSAVVARYGDVAEEMIAKVNRAEWKRRQYPIGPKFSKTAFGRGRNVPITR